MTVTSESINIKENGKFLCKEILTSKVYEDSFLKMEICKDKNSENYDSYQFTNQNGDTITFRALELTELLTYFKGFDGKTNGISMSVYNIDLMSPELIKEFNKHDHKENR